MSIEPNLPEDNKLDHKTLVELARRKDPKVEWFEYQGIWETLGGHCRRLGIGYNTAKSRKLRHREKGPEYWLKPGQHKKGPPKLRPIRPYYWEIAAKRGKVP